MRKVVVLENQNIFDIATQEYGGVEGVFWIMTDNNIPDLDQEMATGTELYIREGVTIPEFIEYTAPERAAVDYKTVIVEQGQNLFDIAVQEYGGIEGVVHLIQDNGLDVNARLEPGQELKVFKSKAVDKAVESYLSDRRIKIGLGDKKSGGGDFNSDFNEDFF